MADQVLITQSNSFVTFWHICNSAVSCHFLIRFGSVSSEQDRAAGHYGAFWIRTVQSWFSTPSLVRWTLLWGCRTVVPTSPFMAFIQTVQTRKGQHWVYMNMSIDREHSITNSNTLQLWPDVQTRRFLCVLGNSQLSISCEKSFSHISEKGFSMTTFWLWSLFSWNMALLHHLWHRHKPWQQNHCLTTVTPTTTKTCYTCRRTQKHGIHREHS